METALVRASPAAPRVRRALRVVIVAGGATLAVGAALLQPFGAGHLFPVPPGPTATATAPPSLPPAAAPAAPPAPAPAEAGNAIAPVAPPPAPAASTRSPSPAAAASGNLSTAAVQQPPAPPPEVRAGPSPSLGPPPLPREPLPLQTDLIDPITPAALPGATAAAPATPTASGVQVKPAAGDRHG